MPGSMVRNILAVAFGLLLLSMLPALLGSFIKPAVAQAPNATSLAQDLPQQEDFSVDVLATNFSAPHNILYGPDGALWITERTGKSISRVDPDSGDKLANITVPNVHQSGGQDGLMGMAFDPDFNNTNHIYVAYTYDADSGEELDRRTKITRFTYDAGNGTIGGPVDLISGLSGSVDHNSGRMAFGADGTTIFVITDSSGPVQAIEGGPIAEIKDPGSVLVFKYQGSVNQTAMNSTSPIS